MDAQDLESEYGICCHPHRGIELVAGDGAEVVDSGGRTYIDCVAGHGSASLGHGHPRLSAAIADQARDLISCTAGFANRTRAELLAEIFRISPPGLRRSFLCNSGTEAVEAALKFARLTTGRGRVVCARRAFHGRTMGALSATFKPEFRRGVEPLLPGFEFVSFNDGEALLAAVNEETAAVILEPVQGEGGVHVGERGFLAAARSACDAAGSVLIFDEVQTGFCRTGMWFACQYSEVTPDIICAAKGMGGGVPIGATICADRIDVPYGAHGSTFGGNPLACSAALATIREMQNLDLAEQVAEKGAYLANGLKTLDARVVREVRGLGLMVGVDLRVRVRSILDKLAELGVLAMAAGPTVLRLLPPLIITSSQIDTILGAVSEAFDDACP